MYLYVYVLYVCTHLISIEYNLHLLLDIIAYGFPIYWQIPIRVFRRGLEGHVAYATEKAETSVAASAVAATAQVEVMGNCGKTMGEQGKVRENDGTLRATLWYGRWCEFSSY